MNKHLLVAIAAATATLCAVPAQAQDAGNLIVRARVVNIDPANDSSPNINLAVNSKAIPEVDFTYFFTPNLAAELILTYPQKHNVTLGGAQIGTLKHLPPTLTAQYHFTGLGNFRPYLGAGINYTNFSSVNLPAGITIENSSWGLALQAGVDVPLGGGWLLNADVKKVQIRTDVSNGGAFLTNFKVDPVLLGIGVGKRF